MYFVFVGWCALYVSVRVFLFVLFFLVRSCMTYIIFYLAVLSVAEHGGHMSESPTIVVDLCIYSFGSISFVLCILRLCCLVFIKLVVLYLSVEFILLLLHNFCLCF